MHGAILGQPRGVKDCGLRRLARIVSSNLTIGVRPLRHSICRRQP